MEYNRIYQNLNNNDAAALNESIMDAGIRSFPELEAAWNQATKFLDEQPSQTLTFKQFQATRTARTWSQDRCDEVGLELESAEMLEYGNECFIQVLSPSRYYLIIETKEWRSNDLASLEWLLYSQWYNPSC